MSLDTSKTIKRLETYNSSPAPILSVYFKLPVPKLVTETTIINKFQSIINANLSIEQRGQLKNNIEYIIGVMQNYQQERGERTIAFFSGGDNLFEILHLPYDIKNTVKCSHSPYLEPLLKAQEATRRYLVILNERKRAIFYTILSGNVEDQKIITTDDVPQDVSGNWPAGPRTDRHDKVQRHVRGHLYHHFDFVAKKAEEFIKRKSISGVILGGHKADMSQFEKHLPNSLKQKVVGKFVSELKTNFNEILNRSNEIIKKVDKKFNQQISPYVT